MHHGTSNINNNKNNGDFEGVLESKTLHDSQDINILTDHQLWSYC